MCVTRLSIVDWVLFQGSDFAEDLEDSKSTSIGVLCIFGRRNQSQSVGCARHKLLSHSCTESEIVSLDAPLRMDGVGCGGRSMTLIKKHIHQQPHRILQTKVESMSCGKLNKNLKNVRLKKKGNQNVEQLSNPDHVTTNETSSHCVAQFLHL